MCTDAAVSKESGLSTLDGTSINKSNLKIWKSKGLLKRRNFHHCLNTEISISSQLKFCILERSNYDFNLRIDLKDAI